MRFLFISRDCIGVDLARRLQDEGSEVKLYIIAKKAKKNFTNIVPKITNLQIGLDWVREENGTVIFDDIGYGKMQDELRAQGYNVFGGSHEGELLETNRSHAMSVFKNHKLPSIPTFDFSTIDETIDFLNIHSGPWVIKMNRSSLKHLSCISRDVNNSDIIRLLETYKELKLPKITLQKTITGIEVAVTRMFNGSNWVGPIIYNAEHPHLFPGDIGPLTAEMGTLAWCDNNVSSSTIYAETLEKLEPYLRKVNYRGCIDINCIVNQEGIYPIEATMRMGNPMIHLLTTLFTTPWSHILSAVAKGKDIEVSYRKDCFGIVVVCASPPFPYIIEDINITPLGNKINLTELSEFEMNRIHFEEVAKESSSSYGEYVISDTRGYTLHVTGYANTIKETQEMVYSIVQKVSFPKMFYRNDIGSKFDRQNYTLLKKWGYI